MERVNFKVPKMYADHHVKVVKQALEGLSGVASVIASALHKRVMVEYDPAATDPAAIEERLRAAGYGPGEDWKLPRPPEAKESVWRVARKEIFEREMAGDFRKY
jgi:copper chaperone